MTPSQVIGLLAEPEKLMRRCYVHIAGGATRSAGLPDAPRPPPNGTAQIATFSVVIDNQRARGFTTGISGTLGVTKDRPFVKINKRLGTAVTPPPRDHFNAYYIPMVQTGDVADNTSHYTLPTAPGSLDIMLTSKLSGCTFSVGSNATGAVLVSHIQPDAAIKAGTPALSALGQTGMASSRGEFKRGAEYSHLASVIGRRHGDVWTFYMQASTMEVKANGFGDHIVSSTRRL